MIQTYNDMKITLIEASQAPNIRVSLALNITMAADPNFSIKNLPELTSKKAKFLTDAEHTSVLEHVNYCFLITGISRSLLAQLTRQRHSSPTSGSQHYQDYSDYPAAADKGFPLMSSLLIKECVETYQHMIQTGMPKEEARQVLPNAMVTNYMLTINARSLMLFFRHRLCHRNVKEMRIFANKLLRICYAHFPNLFQHAGPQCFMDGKCKQGHMSCGRIWEGYEF